jgi:hypothetical protein
LTLSTAASPSTFDSDTDQIAEDIIAQEKSFVFPKVLVIDFPLQTDALRLIFGRRPFRRSRCKTSGRNAYDVFDAQGNPLLIIPHRPLKPEFDDIAIEAIKTWKARPAAMQGKPIAVCTTIEMNWRLY